MDQKTIAQQKLNELNPLLKEMGFPLLKLVSPVKCIPQKKNARYFDVQTFNQLVANIKADGRLEGTPLCYETEESLNLPDNEKEYGIISGHHRIEASKAAHLDMILIMVIELKKGNDELRSKQLSHNSLVGKDDQAVLKDLFDEIKDIEFKVMSGLKSEIEKISYTSLNFKIGSFKNFSVTFLPEDEEVYQEAISQIEEFAAYRSGEMVQLAPLPIYDKFADGIRAIKKIENIKSNATAFRFLLELGLEALKNYELQKATKDEI